jgi:hypothetical protein
MQEQFCDGCEKKLDVGRSELYCPKCCEEHKICLDCLFKPPMEEYNPMNGRPNRYWMKCPIPFLRNPNAPR